MSLPALHPKVSVDSKKAAVKGDDPPNSTLSEIYE